MSKVDILINAYGKPYQTALTLLSLMQHSGSHIDKIWLVLDRPDFAPKLGRQFILDLLPNIEVYKPVEWRWISHIDETRLGEEDYRHSIRYQYGWERSDKEHVLIVHNDIHVTADVVSLLLSRIEGHIAAGEIGQCWICPAHHHGRCNPERYLDYRPSLAEFLMLAKDPKGKVLTDVTNYMVCPSIKRRPWPLPPCRVNEWCALIDLGKARTCTVPFGSARPFGAHVFEGIIRELGEGETWQEFTNNLGIVYDTGIAWFRDVHHMGHTCAHVPLTGYMEHSFGHRALFKEDLYAAKEGTAKQLLEKEFGLKFAP